jgi:hypothetical protein
MFKIAKKPSVLLLAMVALLEVSACSAPAQPPAPSLNFTSSPTIQVNVARIETVEAYKSPYSAPNVEHLMSYTPADAMAIWIKDRLRATGHDKLLQITIVDASVKESDLPTTKGIKGLFTVDQNKRYDARLEVEMKIYGEGALSESSTSAFVTRSITIPENASVIYRKNAYEKMLQELMKMLNDKLENNMLNYMGNYVYFSNK